MPMGMIPNTHINTNSNTNANTNANTQIQMHGHGQI